MPCGTQIQTYLTQRAPLRRLFLLVDGRHGIKVNDRAFMEELDRCGERVQPSRRYSRSSWLIYGPVTFCARRPTRA